MFKFLLQFAATIGLCSSDKELNILLLTDTSTNANQWPVIVDWAKARVRQDHLLPDNYSLKWVNLVIGNTKAYSVIIVPTCSMNDDEINSTVTDLHFSMINTVLHAQRQLAVAGKPVHAFVGPPCMTGMIVNAGLAAVQNIPVVSYYSVAFQVQTGLKTTYSTLSSVSVMNTQQGG